MKRRVLGDPCRFAMLRIETYHVSQPTKVELDLRFPSKNLHLLNNVLITLASRTFKS